MLYIMKSVFSTIGIFVVFILACVSMILTPFIGAKLVYDAVSGLFILDVILPVLTALLIIGLNLSLWAWLYQIGTRESWK
jgi:hypothetical protein